MYLNFYSYFSPVDEIKKKKSPASKNVFIYSLWVFQGLWLRPLVSQNSVPKIKQNTNSLENFTW